MSSPEAIANQNVKDKNDSTFHSEPSSLTRSATTAGAFPPSIETRRSQHAKCSRPRTSSVLDGGASLTTSLGGFSLPSFSDQSFRLVADLHYLSEPTDIARHIPLLRGHGPLRKTARNWGYYSVYKSAGCKAEGGVDRKLSIVNFRPAGDATAISSRTSNAMLAAMMDLWSDLLAKVTNKASINLSESI